MKLFSKENSRFLSVANSLLLGQVGIGVVYFLMMVFQVIFLAEDSKVESVEWIRVLITISVGAAMLGLVNANKTVFEPKLARAEKLFKLLTLAVFDVSFCMAISYLLSLPFETSDLSEKAIMHSIGGASAVAIVFLASFLLIPRLKLFRQSYSRRMNAVILGLALGLSCGLAGLFSTAIEGPNGSSESTQVAFSEQILHYGLVSGGLGIGVAALAVKKDVSQK